MKLIICLVFIGILLSVGSISSAGGNGGGFVGNGGDAIDLNGQLYMRDLWSVGLQTTSFIGNATDPVLSKIVDSLEIPVSKTLLVRKLTDLNGIWPGLGDDLATAMRLYTWSLEDSPLTPIPTSPDPVEIPPSAKLVQIANRLNTQIRIQRASFERLDGANKVALLIHEAVYSLVEPVYLPGGFAQQPAERAREITGLFFNSGFFSKPTNDVAAALSALHIPAEILPLASVRQMPKWHLAFGAIKNGIDGDFVHAPIAQMSFDFNGAVTAPQLTQFAQDFCARAAKLALKYPFGIWVDSTTQARPLKASLQEYRISATEKQNYVTLDAESSVPQTMTFIFDREDRSESDCADSLLPNAESLL